MSSQAKIGRTRYYVGATPAFGMAHSAVDVMLPWPKSEWPLLLSSSRQAADLVDRALPGNGMLSRAAGLLSQAPAGADPLSAWIKAIASAHDVPAWPYQARDRDDGRVRLRLACPYRRPLDAWIALAFALLQLGKQIAEGGEAPVDPDPWQSLLEETRAELPSPDHMELHAALARRGVPWAPLGRERTRIGTGSRQRIAAGEIADPEAFAQRVVERGPSIPLYTVTGSNGKTTTVRLLAAILATTGLRVGFTTSYGAWADGQKVQDGDCLGGFTARAMLHRDDLDVAVLEVGRGGIINQGIPYHRSDVAVLLNVLPEHIGEDGIGTIAQLAEVKATSVRRGRIAVLNHDNAYCREIGASREPATCVWLSTLASAAALRTLSRTSRGALGISRKGDGAPRALDIWVEGSKEQSLDLAGVAPYQGMLGEKSLEELLAAVGAAWFGPQQVRNWDGLLPSLRLEGSDHPFRTSSYWVGNVLFVLDMAGEAVLLEILRASIDALCERHAIRRRIAVLTRSAVKPPEVYQAVGATLHGFMDEFICFDRPDAYGKVNARAEYPPGSMPRVLAAALAARNAETGQDKPITMLGEWDEVETLLRALVSTAEEPVLVLINQPTTAATELNRRILDFVGG